MLSSIAVLSLFGTSYIAMVSDVFVGIAFFVFIVVTPGLAVAVLHNIEDQHDIRHKQGAG